MKSLQLTTILEIQKNLPDNSSTLSRQDLSDIVQQHAQSTVKFHDVDDDDQSDSLADVINLRLLMLKAAQKGRLDLDKITNIRPSFVSIELTNYRFSYSYRECNYTKRFCNVTAEYRMFIFKDSYHTLVVRSAWGDQDERREDSSELRKWSEVSFSRQEEKENMDFIDSEFEGGTGWRYKQSFVGLFEALELKFEKDDIDLFIAVFLPEVTNFYVKTPCENGDTIQENLYHWIVNTEV